MPDKRTSPRPTNPDHTPSFQDVTAVILAGGNSRRMGRDKAQLQVCGQTLFERMLAVLQSLFSRVMIAGERPDLSLPNVPAIADTYPGSAMGGIHTGLSAAQTDWVFIAPCDMPYPDRRVIERLLLCRHHHDAVVPRTPAGFEPVFALYHKRCLPLIETLLKQEKFRIYALYQQLDVRFLKPEELPSNWHRSLLNINTPEDLVRINKTRLYSLKSGYELE